MKGAKKDDKGKKADDKGKDKKDEKSKSKDPKKGGDAPAKGAGSKKALDQSEIPPTDRSVPELPGQDRPQPVCMTHGKHLIMYCTSCEEPICEDCSTVGPHNNQVERFDLNSAYKAAISELSYALSSGLLNKRDLLLAQIHRISHRMDEINYVRGIIEKDIKGEFGGIVDRLKGAEGKKIAVIQNEMAHLQADIDRIETIAAHYEEIKGDKVQFLLRSRNFREDVENILLKAFRTEIDQTPYDLPRELKDLREKLERKTVGNQLLKFKDEIIWRLFNERKNRETQSIDKFNHSVAQEIESWAKLTDKYSGELKKYQLICYFCAEPMGPLNLNKKCKINEAKQIPQGFNGFSQKKPEPDFLGNGRHFFARPKENLFSSNQAFDNLQQLFSDQQSEVIRRKTMYEIENNLVLVKKLAREKNINVENLLKSHDKSDLGMMSKPKFIYLLNEKLGVSVDKVNCFMMLLDPYQKGLINYRDFLQMMNDPELLKVDKEIDGQLVNKDVINLVAEAAEDPIHPDIDMNSRYGGSRQGAAPQKPPSVTGSAAMRR